MNTIMTGFRCFSKIYASVLWTKVASALVGLYRHLPGLSKKIIMTSGIWGGGGGVKT